MPVPCPVIFNLFGDNMEDKQEIKSTDVGSLEEALGTGDPLFKSEAPTAEPINLTDGQEVVDPDAGTQDDPANDHRLSQVDKKPAKDIPEELPIEYLFNPNNKKVFPVNKDIIKQKGLIPCTKEGKLLPDTRRLSEFR